MVNLHGQLKHQLGKRPVNPTHRMPQLQESIDELVSWWSDKTRVLTLTGAGISAESGIPDYRGHNGSFFKGHKPMVHDQFMQSHLQRQRYWGRGMLGWKHMETRKPSRGHVALAALERMGKIGVEVLDQPHVYLDPETSHKTPSSTTRSVSVITQNVDGLHRRARTRHSIDLHGRLDEVICMSCGATHARSMFQERLETINRDWLERMIDSSNITIRADGDADGVRNYEQVQVPECASCGKGILKPNVVFFGDTVPSHRTHLCKEAVDACDGLLVVGSSLAVYSAFRHVRSLHQRGVDIAIVNVGETRAEKEGLPVLKIEAPVGPTLQGVVSRFEE